jgi:hypothetical protein
MPVCCLPCRPCTSATKSSSILSQFTGPRGFNWPALPHNNNSHALAQLLVACGRQGLAVGLGWLTLRLEVCLLVRQCGECGAQLAEEELREGGQVGQALHNHHHNSPAEQQALHNSRRPRIMTALSSWRYGYIQSFSSTTSAEALYAPEGWS